MKGGERVVKDRRMSPAQKRTLYLDLSTGVSGDMLLAALSSASGLSSTLINNLQLLNFDSFELRLGKARVGGIVTSRAEIVQKSNQPLRHLSDLLKILDKSSLEKNIKDESEQVLRLLGEAEAKVHGIELEKVHFHEIGAVDTIVDIVGVIWLARNMNVQRIICSPVNLGSGFVQIAHGLLPVPAPACAELSKGMRVFSTDMGMEAATPTGLALVKHLADEYSFMPACEVERVGYGSGSRSTDERPSYVRAFLIREVKNDS